MPAAPMQSTRISPWKYGSRGSSGPQRTRRRPRPARRVRCNIDVSSASSATWEEIIPTAPSLTLLLQAASQNRTDLTLADFRVEQVRWAVETGLGPLLRRSTANDPRARTSPLWSLVRGADLTARVIAGDQMNAMDEIIRACEGQVPPLTLLKGISICEQHYPEPHLRLMRDIDVLVDQVAIPTVESLLLQLGYRHDSENPPEFYDTHHHITPFFHPGTRVWVEIHRGLFPAASQIGSDGVFSLENLKAELRPSAFRGWPVNRLSDELQVVFLASHWAFGFRRVGGMVGMLDLIYLLKNARTLRWERILDWLEGSVASTYVYLLLTYLGRHRLVDIAPEILRELSLRQRTFGPVNLKIVHALIDRYVTNGRDFGLLVSARNFAVLWRTLLLPDPPSRNVGRALWNLLPSRAWLMRQVTRRGTRP